MPSLLAERVSLIFKPLFDAVGVTGVDGVAAVDELVAFRAAVTGRGQRDSHERNNIRVIMHGMLPYLVTHAG